MLDRECARVAAPHYIAQSLHLHWSACLKGEDKIAKHGMV